MQALTLTMTPLTILRTALTTVAAAALLSACSGGGGGGPSDNGSDSDPGTTPPPVNPVAFSAEQLQGRWLTSSGISPASTGLVLPGSSGTTELWVLANDLSSLTRAQITTSGADVVSAAGKSYSLPSSSSQVGQAASYSGTANLTNNTLSLNAGTLLFTRTADLKAASGQSDIAGTWSGSAGGQTVTFAWTIAANGTLSAASSTPGCSYSGSVIARSDATAYNASVTETCPGFSPISFSGIGTYRAPQGSIPAALTLAMTSTDANQTQALVVGLTK